MNNNYDFPAEPSQAAAHALNLLQAVGPVFQTEASVNQLLSVVCAFQQRQVIHHTTPHIVVLTHVQR